MPLTEVNKMNILLIVVVWIFSMISLTIFLIWATAMGVWSIIYYYPIKGLNQDTWAGFVSLGLFLILVFGIFIGIPAILTKLFRKNKS